MLTSLACSSESSCRNMDDGSPGSLPRRELGSTPQLVHFGSSHSTPLASVRDNFSHLRLDTHAQLPSVNIYPKGAAKRRATAWRGMAVEIVETTSFDNAEFRYRAPAHLLAIYVRGVRRQGESYVEGLCRSTLKDFTQKLTFVPAGHEYREWLEPRSTASLIFLYIDPAILPDRATGDSGATMLAPRIFFEDQTLWDTALKLKCLIQDPAAEDRDYLEAVGTVLIHELIRLNRGTALSNPIVRGGLAAWQKRVVAAYIEEHLDEPIPLAKLAQLVQLSPYHFCRTFKQSFGVPPHRYHMNRRIERAKEMLAKPAICVTDIGLTVGFSETSSFTAAFRKATGLTPTAYHRCIS